MIESTLKQSEEQSKTQHKMQNMFKTSQKKFNTGAHYTASAKSNTKS